jgi:hypothetical protein
MMKVYQLRPLVLPGKFRPKQSAASVFYTLKVARQKYLMLQTEGLNVKWRELEFSLLPSSALKCVARIVAIRGV